MYTSTMFYTQTTCFHVQTACRTCVHVYVFIYSVRAARMKEIRVEMINSERLKVGIQVSWTPRVMTCYSFELPCMWWDYSNWKKLLKCGISCSPPPRATLRTTHVIFRFCDTTKSCSQRESSHTYNTSQPTSVSAHTLCSAETLPILHWQSWNPGFICSLFDGRAASNTSHCTHH